MKTSFSICLMNPPYSSGIHESFLYKILGISNKIVTELETSREQLSILPLLIKIQPGKELGIPLISIIQTPEP